MLFAPTAVTKKSGYSLFIPETSSLPIPPPCPSITSTFISVSPSVFHGLEHVPVNAAVFAAVGRCVALDFKAAYRAAHTRDIVLLSLEQLGGRLALRALLGRIFALYFKPADRADPCPCQRGTALFNQLAAYSAVLAAVWRSPALVDMSAYRADEYRLSFLFPWLRDGL